MFRFLSCLGIVFLFLLRSYAQDKPADISGLLGLMKKTAADTNRVSLLLKIGDAYVMKPGDVSSDLDSALYYTNWALKLSTSLGEPRWQGKSLIVLSNVYREKKELTESRSSVLKAIDILKKCSCNSEVGDAYIALGMLCETNSDSTFRIKVDIYKQALHYYELADDKEKQANVLREIGDYHQVVGDVVQALSELKQSLAIYKSNRIIYRMYILRAQRSFLNIFAIF